MKKISLNGRHRLYFYDAGDYDADTPDGLTEGLADGRVRLIPADVPGNAELALADAGLLPKDLYFGNNILETQKFEQYDFWYGIDFKLTEKQLLSALFLEFQGADTIAAYFLNGVKIGESRNMLIPHTFGINGCAKAGVNKLFVKLASAVRYAAQREFPSHIAALAVNHECAVIRKAAHSFGWDIMPRAVSCGIWRDVSLVEKGEVEIEDYYLGTIHVNPELTGALVWFNYHVKMPARLFGKLTITIAGGCGADSAFEYTEKLRFPHGTARIPVNKNLRLWYPRGYGKPDLYDAEITVKDENGKVLAVRRQKFGIRQVNIEYSETGGKDGFFRVLINNTQIMVKGTNYVPADAFHSRDKARLPQILNEIDFMGCNAIRCWGGGVYEDDAFFDFCDARGIMVWQDFAMACSTYPYDEDFCKELKNEVRQAALRLRNYCSLIVWCGDNECDIALICSGLDPNTNVLTRRVIPETLRQWDHLRAYIPSSPYISPETWKQKAFDCMPENHLWGPRDNYKSSYYTRETTNFVGETGYQGCPNVSSIKRFISADKLWPPENNDEWITHCTSPDGAAYTFRVKLMSDQIREMFGEIPDNLEDFALASQISQAEAKKFFIEYTRQKKWFRSGILWWNAMDGWPQFSDAVVDYYGGRKLAAYYIRRSQQPLTPIMKEPSDWGCELMVANDSSADKSGAYEVTDADTGEVLLSGNFVSKANENRVVGKIPVSNGVHRLFLLKLTTGKETFVNHYLHGNAPFDFKKYKAGLEKIAAIDNTFNAARAGK